MVIWFNSEKPRKYLEDNKIVYTFRVKRKQFGRTKAIYNDEIHGKTNIGNVIVQLVDESHDNEHNHKHKNVLSKYVEHSGFDSIDEWLKEICRLNNNRRLPVYGKILKVNIIMQCAQCGDWTDNFCIIEECTQEVNPIEYIWNKIGMEGKPICVECYYK